MFYVDQKGYPAIYASGYGWQLLWVIPDLEMEKVLIPAALID